MAVVAGTETPAESPAAERCRIFISYKRDAEPDMSLASFLYTKLTSQGYSVFKDIEGIPTGVKFQELIATEITQSDFFVVLLTKKSTAQGWVVAETEAAKDHEALAGHPKILPVRLAYTQNLPLGLRAAIGHLHHFEWRDSSDNDKLVTALVATMGTAERDGEPKPTALVRGEHFIITGRMWESAATRESLAGTTIVPVIAGQETRLAVTRAKGPGLFRVKILDGGALEVAIWSGTNYRRVRSQPQQFIPMLEADTHSWCFEKYTPDQPILLKRPDGGKDPIVVTVDPDVVRAVWMITHQRETIRESFLIAMKEPA